ncbi:hypothetical protein [Anoxybacillus kestanbolensis]|nr:hypothetical protein [Anoxybacillus kestanbolensis]
MSEMKKKLFYKRWWVWALTIIIVVAVASGGNASIQDLPRR